MYFCSQSHTGRPSAVPRSMPEWQCAFTSPGISSRSGRPLTWASGCATASPAAGPTARINPLPRSTSTPPSSMTALSAVIGRTSFARSSSRPQMIEPTMPSSR